MKTSKVKFITVYKNRSILGRSILLGTRIENIVSNIKLDSSKKLDHLISYFYSPNQRAQFINKCHLHAVKIAQFKIFYKEIKTIQ